VLARRCRRARFLHGDAPQRRAISERKPASCPAPCQKPEGPGGAAARRSSALRRLTTSTGLVTITSTAPGATLQQRRPAGPGRSRRCRRPGPAAAGPALKGTPAVSTSTSASRQTLDVVGAGHRGHGPRTAARCWRSGHLGADLSRRCGRTARMVFAGAPDQAGVGPSVTPTCPDPGESRSFAVVAGRPGREGVPGLRRREAHLSLCPFPSVLQQGATRVTARREACRQLLVGGRPHSATVMRGRAGLESAEAPSPNWQIVAVQRSAGPDRQPAGCPSASRVPGDSACWLARAAVIFYLSGRRFPAVSSRQSVSVVVPVLAPVRRCPGSVPVALRRRSPMVELAGGGGGRRWVIFVPQGLRLRSGRCPWPARGRLSPTKVYSGCPSKVAWAEPSERLIVPNRALDPRMRVAGPSTGGQFCAARPVASRNLAGRVQGGERVGA